MRIFSILILSILAGSLHSQSLTITDGSQTETFRPDGYYEITLKDNQCCTGLYGSITAIDGDRITMQLDKFGYNSKGDIKLQHHLLQKEEDTKYSFSVNHLRELTYYKSRKGKKWNRTLTGIGAILVFTGIASASHYFILSDTDSKRTMAISGGIQFGVGLIMALFTSNN